MRSWIIVASHSLLSLNKTDNSEFDISNTSTKDSQLCPQFHGLTTKNDLSLWTPWLSNLSSLCQMSSYKFTFLCISPNKFHKSLTISSFLFQWHFGNKWSNYLGIKFTFIGILFSSEWSYKWCVLPAGKLLPSATQLRTASAVCKRNPHWQRRCHSFFLSIKFSTTPQKYSALLQEMIWFRFGRKRRWFRISKLPSGKTSDVKGVEVKCTIWFYGFTYNLGLGKKFFNIAWISRF